MEQAKLDKIRRVLERMDRDYWVDLADQTNVFDTRLHNETDKLFEVLSNLIAAQCDVLSARHDGFRQIVQAADTAAANAATAAQTAKGGKSGRGNKTAATAAQTQETAINAIIAANAAKLAALTEARQSALEGLTGVLIAIQNIFDEAAKMGEAFTPTQAAKPPVDTQENK